MKKQVKWFLFYIATLLAVAAAVCPFQFTDRMPEQELKLEHLKTKLERKLALQERSLNLVSVPSGSSKN